MDNQFVEMVHEEMETELYVRRTDVERALLFAVGYDEKMRLLEEAAFIDKVDANVYGLLAELENKDAEIEVLRKKLADYHQAKCPLVLGDSDECACEAAPPLLNISDFDGAPEAIVISPARPKNDTAPHIVSGCY